MLAELIISARGIQMRITTDALVIKEMNVGENDRLVTLMTHDMGVIKAYAAGAKSIKSKRGAATGLLAYSSFQLQKKGDTYRISEATPNKIFFGSGSDIVTLSLSQYFCELCSILGPQDSTSDEFLRLILNSLNFIGEGKRSPVLIKAITELRVAAISGYMPNLIACDGCGEFEDDIMYFRIGDGRLFCDDCRVGEGLVKINRTILEAMRHIVFSKFNQLYSFEIPESDAEYLSNLTERYITVQTDHRFTTLDFYNSVK